MAIGGALLKTLSTALYAMEFACAGIILGIYSYFMSVQADRDVHIPVWQQAVEGIAGVIVLYTLIAILLTCCLGGKTIFAFLAIVLNLLCCGGMIAIAVLTRDGASKCTGNVRTPLGNGPKDSKDGFGNQTTYKASLGSICKMNTACFAVAIVGAFLFLLSIPVQILLGRHHKKEKRFGPSPTNGYTKGSSKKKFWQRKRATKGVHDPEVAQVPVTSGSLSAGHNHDMRPSHDTAYTGSTVAAPNNTYEHSKTTHSGYHTAPTGTHTTHSTGTHSTGIHPNGNHSTGVHTTPPSGTYTTPMTGTYTTPTTGTYVVPANGTYTSPPAGTYASNAATNY